MVIGATIIAIVLWIATVLYLIYDVYITKPDKNKDKTVVKDLDL